MVEKGFNLFAFVSQDYVKELGFVVHDVEGSDDEKLALLKNTVSQDANLAKRHPVPPRYLVAEKDGHAVPGIHYQILQQMVLGGRCFEVFEEVLEKNGAGDSPILCVTQIV